jgi:hypothetical protein
MGVFFIDLTGQIFGRLLVLKVVGRRGRDVLWRCRCDCGNLHQVSSPNLRKGLIRSCGCLGAESRRRRLLRRPPIIEGQIAKIPLTRGLVAIVDAIDADVGLENWSAFKTEIGWYGCRRLPMPDGRILLLHREVARRAGMTIDDLEVDHRDGDGLNCRRENLRPATSSQNKCNRRTKPGKDGIRGVRWYAPRRKWTARIGIDGRSIHLGYFEDQTAAVAAYAEAAKRLHGEFARLA